MEIYYYCYCYFEKIFRIFYIQILNLYQNINLVQVTICYFLQFMAIISQIVTATISIKIVVIIKTVKLQDIQYYYFTLLASLLNYFVKVIYINEQLFALNYEFTINI